LRKLERGDHSSGETGQAGKGRANRLVQGKKRSQYKREETSSEEDGTIDGRREQKKTVGWLGKKIGAKKERHC